MKNRSHFLTESDDLLLPRLHIFFKFNGGQSQFPAAFDLQMAVEMLDAGNDPFAFGHVRPGP